MKKIAFDINQRPIFDSEYVAYMVDSKNVNIMRQYVVQYYSQHYWDKNKGKTYVDWFDATILSNLKRHPDRNYFIYFYPTALGWDENNSVVHANQTYYKRYYIYQNALMLVE